MEELKVTKEMLEEYTQSLAEAGLAESSYLSYKTKLRKMYQLLPEDKTIRQGTIAQLSDQLQEKGYSPASINVFFSVANGLLAHYGCRNLQIDRRMTAERHTSSALDRNEYWRLLLAARENGKRKTFTLIKTFAILGISTKDLSCLTVEAVEEGSFKASSERIYIPEIFRKELKEYICSEGISSGPLFMAQNGKSIGRSSVINQIRSLHLEARVPADKCNPRCLQMLYRQTKEELESSVRFLVELEFNKLLQDEKFNLPW